MRKINYSADELAAALLNLESERGLCLLDSCGVSHLDSHLLIAGINPIETLELTELSAEKTLAILDEKLAPPDLAAMLTISYDFGLKLNNIKPRPKEFASFDEPDVFLTLFDVLIVHDYNAQESFLVGNSEKFDEIERIIAGSSKHSPFANSVKSQVSANFTREEYLNELEKIQEFIRQGDTYQTNLTQQIRAELPENLSAETVFANLRRNYPAPFAAFLRRKNDVVISASPERFFSVRSSQHPIGKNQHSKITVSPIKGTRPRGKNPVDDELLRNELLNSEKDQAENVMIVDLLRNDIGRICEYGSVEVEKLCDLEEHPTLFHLVSTISGVLRKNLNLSDILQATFPCGSITGAPKIRTMQIIDELETAPRNLSMGAIGYVAAQNAEWSRLNDNCSMDFSVAIRTMTLRGNQAVFNVGGGITIDSLPEDEYLETLVKAKALLESINAETKF